MKSALRLRGCCFQTLSTQVRLRPSSNISHTVYLFRGRVKIGPVVRRNPYLPRKTIREPGLRLAGTCKIFLENIC